MTDRRRTEIKGARSLLEPDPGGFVMQAFECHRILSLGRMGSLLDLGWISGQDLVVVAANLFFFTLSYGKRL